MKNGVDWLKFVFERWFAIEYFLRRNEIDRFWHFDSDTMILDDLRLYKKRIEEYDFSVQCNGACLNGFSTRSVVEEYCSFICNLFQDEEFIENQMKEFREINENYAFTEMRAFEEYQKVTNKNGIHLLNFSKEKVFDDCITQSHGYSMVEIASGHIVKEIEIQNGSFYGFHEFNGRISFATLNLSWVPIELFDWVLLGIESRETKNIRDLKFSILKKIKFALRSLKSYARKKVSNGWRKTASIT